MTPDTLTALSERYSRLAHDVKSFEEDALATPENRYAAYVYEREWLATHDGTSLNRTREHAETASALLGRHLTLCRDLDDYARRHPGEELPERLARCLADHRCRDTSEPEGVNA